MEYNREYKQIKKECVQYFKKNTVWKRVFEEFRKKYISYGRFTGKIVLKKLSYDDIDELEGFFGRNYHGKKSVVISSEMFVKAIESSRYSCVTSEDIMKEYFGTDILGKAEIKARWEQGLYEIEQAFQTDYKNTPAAEVISELILIVKNTRNNINNKDVNKLESELQQWKQTLYLCAKLYNALPYRYGQKMYVAVFAAKITGNPHAFDAGTSGGNILYQIIKTDIEYRNISIDSVKLFPMYKRQKCYLMAGIMIDDVSNYTLLYNIRVIKKDGSRHRGIEGFYEEKDIIQVPLNIITEWEKIECVDNEIYIVENPSVFAMICGKKSCMCMNGQPRLAGLIVLELLVKSGIHVYYSGDLDPEGILIAQKLSMFYKGDFTYWHMTVNDYKECMSDEVISDKRCKMLNNITDEALIPVSYAIKRNKRAGYQENIPYKK